MRSLLVEAHSGISGDMFVAAASALAECEDEILALPRLLGLDGVNCRFSVVNRASISCRKFEVLMGGEAADAQGMMTRSSERQHNHRSLSDIQALILQAPLDAPVQQRAIRMFNRLGDIEAGLHGVPPAEVIFHEIGAVDSIIDIVAAVLCIERLKVEAVFCTSVCVGSGTVRMDHGWLPVPAPATDLLLQGIPIQTGDVPGEWTTPTGALILGELDASFDWPVHTTVASAYGGGSKDVVGRANILRLRLAEVKENVERATSGDEVVELRCNLDDSTGEMLGADLAALLLDQGALDVAVYPVVMKKGRPGHVLELLVDAERSEEIASLVLEVTSTIGIRMSRVKRMTLARRSAVVQTPYGEVCVKVVQLPSGRTRMTPEFESCRRLAADAGVPVREVYDAAYRAGVKE